MIRIKPICEKVLEYYTQGNICPCFIFDYFALIISG